ncbi:MAG: dihydrodipicolinate reductase [Paracoccaceae bacterium]
MFKTIALAAFALFPALPACAEFMPVNDRDEFLRVVDGRELRLGVFQIELKITPDGQINGSALGWDVTGTWAWEDGYFCREIDWSGKPIPYNCQLVEVQDNAKIRFTVDKGAGDEATFNLR